MKGVLAAGIALTALFTSAATVLDVVAQQRWPWNGLVDIDYTIAGDEVENTAIAVKVTDGDTGASYDARSFLEVPPMSAGRHRITWSTAADGLSLVSSNVTFEVTTLKRDAMVTNGLFYVVDLSDGTNATRYPVSNLSAAPVGGWTDEYKTTKLVMRRIEAGSFIMGGGTMNESKRVTISNPFYMGVFEVTQRQWELVMGSNPSRYNDAMRPVEQVSYNDIRGSSDGSNWPTSSAVDATNFLGRLRAKTGLDGFDLPTEAQWEYACRAGTISQYNNGGDTEDDLKALGRYSGNQSDGRGDYMDAHTTVGSYTPNAWGLYDMHGNVWEWCLDGYGSSLSYGIDPVGSALGSVRVRRGGCWLDDMGDCASSHRGRNSPSGRGSGLGFRLVCVANPSTSSGRTVIDTRAGTGVALPSAGAETLRYSNLWSGDASATVTIAQDGRSLAEGLSGEDAYEWRAPGNGTYVLTHTTYTNGVKGAVETAVFTVTGLDVPFADGDVSVTDWSGKYDGAAHGVSVAVADGIADAAVKYAHALEGQGMADGGNGGATPSAALSWDGVPPLFTDAGTYTVWCEVSAPGYIPLTNSATVSISPRSVTLMSASASKVYDGSPLVDDGVTVGGDGFADGEGASFTVTGSQTAVGESANSFTYALNANTKASNYAISTSFGTLAVAKATLGGGNGSGGAGGDFGSEGESGSGTVEPGGGAIVEGGLSKFDTASTYDGLGHTIDTNALLQAFRAAMGGDVVVSYSVGRDVPIAPQDGTDTASDNGGAGRAALPDGGTDAASSAPSQGLAWTAASPSFTNAGEHAVWYRVSNPNYEDFTHSAKVTVSPRPATLTSGDGTWTYDGLAHSNATVTAEGFVDGEGVVASGFAEIVDAGERPNAFEYAFLDDTLAANYSVACATGTLSVAAADMGGWTDAAKWSVALAGDGEKYDGAERTCRVTSLSYGGFAIPSFTVSGNAATDAGDYVLTVTGSGNFAGSHSVPWSILPRSVTLTSAGASKTYDGLPLVDGTVTVGGDGFVSGEGATYTLTGSQTAVGESANSFTYALNENTKAGNYAISTSFGTLTVTKATFGGGNGSGGAGGGSGDEGESGSGTVEPGGGAVVEGGLSKFDAVATYDGLGHTVDTNALLASFRAATGGEDVAVFYSDAVDANGMPVWSPDAPAYVNAGQRALLYKVSSRNYADFVHAARVTVVPRRVVLTSGSAAATPDGAPATCGEVTVGGDGFAPGEGAAFAVTGSQTAMGESENAFTYTLNENVKASNYFVTTVFGRLVVAEAEAVKFAKAAVSVKESATYAELTVNRTAKSGRVRARYATEDGTAVAGEDYKATSGVLEWPDGDRKAKKVRIPLIPDLVAAYDGAKSKTFTVRLSAVSADELYDFEHLPTFAGGDVCTVTVTETSKEGVTAASVYAKQAPKRATVKQDEDVPLSSGTFYGVVGEAADEAGNGTLTNGLPKLAAVTFTASAAATPALSAKVAIAGKTYSFSAKGWDETADGEARDQELRTRTLVNVQKSGKAAYTNMLTVAVRDGKTTEWDTAVAGGAQDKADGALDGAAGRADATVELTMNVPDAKGKGMQEGIRYAGALWRQNAKIQAYLDAVTNFAGYYTVALATVDAAVAGGAQDKTDGGTDAQSVGRNVPVAPNSGESAGDGAADGAAIGNGYLTLTVDSKGGVKVAGMLADGATKPSTSPKACAIVVDESSVNGLALLVPVHFAKGTACFGGTLRLRAVADEANPDGSGRRVVVDSSAPLAWYDDSATGCVALHGAASDRETAPDQGADVNCISLAPCGGWYDKVMNLQRHYLDYALSVETADISAFPTDELPAGYGYVAGVSPDGFALALENDKVVYEKKKIVKTNKLTDFSQSTNVCNVSVKLARATGLVTGGFSLWSATEDGAKQKEMTGFKTYGVLLLARDLDAPLDERVIAPGFATKKVKTTYLDEKGKKKTMTWPFSTPFNIVGD